MRVSITDVAKKAQVSIATVSRVINQNDYVAPETRKIVEAAIKKTGYHLPQHHLANHTKNKIIEVILPSVTNPLYAKFYQEIERNLAAENYSSLLKIDNDPTHTLEPYLTALKKGKIAGIITSSNLPISDQNASDLLPIVSFDRHLSKVTVLKCNNLDGGYKIAQKVLSLGKKNILILSGNRADLYPLNDRLKGMLSVFNHYKVNVKTTYIDFESSMMVKKIQIAQIIDSPKFDAICCTDDVTALLVQQHTDEMNYHPLITGFDGTDFIHSFFPELITVKQPIEDITKLMCEILIKKIHHPSKHFESEYIFPVTLLD